MWIAFDWYWLIVTEFYLGQFVVYEAPDILKLLIALWILTTKHVDFLIWGTQDGCHAIPRAETISLLDLKFNLFSF